MLTLLFTGAFRVLESWARRSRSFLVSTYCLVGLLSVLIHSGLYFLRGSENTTTVTAPLTDAGLQISLGKLDHFD